MLARLVLLSALILTVFLLFTRRGRRWMREYSALLRPALLLSLAFFPLFFPACIFFSSVRLPLKLFVDAAAAALITRSLAPLLHRFLPHLRPGPLAMLPVAVFLMVPTLHYAFFCILSWMFPTMDVWNQ
ncbi:MAG TPA: hypothetical protein H9857_04790 [Candidatus Desulfovibrio intestinigallinarum]|nr:hypothetical protein [Candidatus Desulfovibrio intestinigallinarum]